MSKIFLLVGILLIGGCASTSDTTVQTPPPANTTHAGMMSCIGDFMELQAHVLDATKACSHIFGLGIGREARTENF